MNPAILLAAVGLFQPPAVPRTLATANGRAEVRARQPASVGQTNSRAAFDLDATALGAVDFVWRRTRLEFSYSPRFTWTDFTEIAARDLLNTVGIDLSYSRRRLSLSLVERASYGTRWFSLTSPAELNPVTGDPVLQPVPTAASVRYVGSLSSLSMRYQLSHRSAFSAMAAYSIAGGANSDARRVIPLTSGPQATLEFGYRATRQDTVGPQLAVVYSHTLLGGNLGSIDVGTAALAGLWQRRWGLRTTTDVAAGAIFVHELNNSTSGNMGVAYSLTGAALSHPVQLVMPKFEPKRSNDVYPQAGVALNHAVPLGPERGLLTLTGSAGVGVLINPLAGTAQQSFRGTLQARWATRHVAVLGLLGVTQPLGERQLNAVSAIFSEASVRWAFTRVFGWELGVRAANQSLNRGTTSTALLAPEGTQFVVFTALSFNLEPRPL